MSAPQAAQVALLGTGTVGGAVLQRLSGWRDSGFAAPLELAYVADSRQACCPRSALAGDARPRPVCAAAALDALPARLGHGATRIIIDATASDAVASAHPGWLEQGVHVVTACKLGQGGPLSRWNAIRDACQASGAHYGDRATVGAGLPLLDSLRALRAGGDHIHAIAGVLSGSLAWLLDRFDGKRPFSELLQEARAAGYTEPDPRIDLSGEDVRRKLLILARSIGVPLEVDDVAATPLLPQGTTAMQDEWMSSSRKAARSRWSRLRYVARLQCVEGAWRATCGMEALTIEDPLCDGRGADNQVAIWSDRYSDRPLLIQGPGAGAGVTAAALLDDVLQIARRTGTPAWPVRRPVRAQPPLPLPA